MTNPLSINSALEQLGHLDGMPAELEGILAAGGEGYQLLHYPRSERKADHKHGQQSYEPGVAIEFGNGSLQPNHRALARWLGKRVRVHGLIRTRLLPPAFATMDIFGILWPASIEPFTIQRLTADERRENGV
jgi:hypothetical protein